MPSPVSDEAFARYVNQIGNATFEQIEAAKAVQAENAAKGITLSLGEVLSSFEPDAPMAAPTHVMARRELR